jgi:hypothetical protein
MPPRKSGENAASTAAGTPNLSRPDGVNATWSAVGGGESCVAAFVTGADPSHDRAAAASLTRASTYEASVIRL